MDLSDRRELNNGAGETLARAFELVLTPVIFAGLGLLLDRRLGTGPFVMLMFFAVAVTYEFWKMFGQYNATMKRKEAELLGRRNPEDDES